MKERVISGVFIVIIALAIIIPGGKILLGACYILSMIAYRELAKACGFGGDGKHVTALECVGYLGTTFFYALHLIAYTDVMLLLFMIFVLIAFMFVYVFTFPKYHARQIMAAYFSLIYGPVMLSFIYMCRTMDKGAYVVWMIFISSWVCDTCAYFSGRALGKHKLAPILSPKKTIEGSIGGVIGAAAVAALYAFLVFSKVQQGSGMMAQFAAIVAISALISQVGDLAASGIKRNYEIKDYGHLIPGHGGIMDRFDSVIFTAPITYMMALLLLSAK